MTQEPTSNAASRATTSAIAPSGRSIYFDDLVRDGEVVEVEGRRMVVRYDPAAPDWFVEPEPSAANTRRVVLNDCFGGFGLSHAAVMKLAERKGWTLYPHADDISVKYFGPLEGNEDGYGGVIHYYKVPPEQYHECSEKWRAEDGDYGRINSTDWYFSCHDLERDDPDLVAVVDDLGDAASGAHAELKLVEIPADVEWEISEYDGLEQVAEKHRTWRP